MQCNIIATELTPRSMIHNTQSMMYNTQSMMHKSKIECMVHRYRIQIHMIHRIQVHRNSV